jgi:hypothetical protein
VCGATEARHRMAETGARPRWQALGGEAKMGSTNDVGQAGTGRQVSGHEVVENGTRPPRQALGEDPMSGAGWRRPVSGCWMWRGGGARLRLKERSHSEPIFFWLLLPS